MKKYLVLGLLVGCGPELLEEVGEPEAYSPDRCVRWTGEVDYAGKEFFVTTMGDLQYVCRKGGNPNNGTDGGAGGQAGSSGTGGSAGGAGGSGGSNNVDVPEVTPPQCYQQRVCTATTSHQVCSVNQSELKACLKECKKGPHHWCKSKYYKKHHKWHKHKHYYNDCKEECEEAAEECSTVEECSSYAYRPYCE